MTTAHVTYRVKRIGEGWHVCSYFGRTEVPGPAYASASVANSIAMLQARDLPKDTQINIYYERDQNGEVL